MCNAGTLHKASAGGTTTLTMERGEATIFFKDVPADVCNTCAEAFIDGDVSEDVYEQAEVTVGAVLAVVIPLTIYLVG
jgi:YgiT-type zinc finger domain-containing protein